MNKVKTKAKTTKSGKKSTLKVVSRPVKAPVLVNRKLENFKKLLAKNLAAKTETENIIDTMVDAALVSEFTPNIRKREYYDHMRQTITNALVKNKTLKKEALNVSKSYQKLLN